MWEQLFEISQLCAAAEWVWNRLSDSVKGFAILYFLGEKVSFAAWKGFTIWLVLVHVELFLIAKWSYFLMVSVDHYG